MTKRIVHRESFSVALMPDPEMTQRLVHFKEEIESLQTFVKKEGDEDYVALTPSAFTRLYGLKNIPDFIKFEKGEGDIVGTFGGITMRSGIYQKPEHINMYNLPGYGIGYILQR